MSAPFSASYSKAVHETVTASTSNTVVCAELTSQEAETWSATSFTLVVTRGGVAAAASGVAELWPEAPIEIRMVNENTYPVALTVLETYSLRAMAQGSLVNAIQSSSLETGATYSLRTITVAAGSSYREVLNPSEPYFVAWLPVGQSGVTLEIRSLGQVKRGPSRLTASASDAGSCVVS